MPSPHTRFFNSDLTHILKFQRPVALVFVPLAWWTLVTPDYGAAALLILPLVPLLSTPALRSLLLFHVAVLILLQMVFIEGLADAVTVGCIALGAYSGIRRRLFVSDLSRRPVVLRFVIRHAPAIRALATTIACTATILAMFRGNSWIGCLGLALGYFALHGFLAAFAPKRMVTLKQALINAALLLLSVAVGLTVLEIGARYFLNIPQPPRPSIDFLIGNDNTLWALRPSMEFDAHYSRPEGKMAPFHVRHSSTGLRGPETEPKADGEFRILLLGDSLTYGWGVDEGADIASRLREISHGDAARPVSVVNMGVPGFAPWQELALFEKIGLPMKPDLVVLQLFPANDIPDSIAKDGSVLPVFGVYELQRLLYWRSHANWAPRMERRLRAASTAYNAYRATRHGGAGLPAQLARFRLAPKRFGNPLPTRISKRTYWLEVLLKDWYPELDMAWSEFKRDYTRILDRCRAEDIGVIAYSVPYQFFSDEEWGDLFRDSERKAGGPIKYEPHKDTRLIEDLFVESGVDWLPVYERMRTSQDPRALFLPQDGHLSEAGCQLVAEMIHERLIEDGYLATP